MSPYEGDGDIEQERTEVVSVNMPTDVFTSFSLRFGLTCNQASGR